MSATVEIPLWVLVLILGFAVVAALDRVLVPSVRWYFRRRMERVVAKLNESLVRPIQPFKLASRHDMIQRLIHDPEIARATAAHARAAGVREDVAFETARIYAREIVPAFSATAYFAVATRLARRLSRALYDVRLTGEEEALAGIEPDATIVFVMNHRSNMDYVLVTWLAARRSALSYAVGEWARFWPLTPLIRAMGAYFIRRRAREPLYRRVLARYVQLATAAGVTQALFPEGGLSLDGRIAAPKLGLLSYMIGAAEDRPRDIVFVPVAVNYDRVLEDGILIGAHAAGTRRFRAPWGAMMRYLARHLRRRLLGRRRRFGRAAVSFGAPLSHAAFESGRADADPASLGAELMARIGAAMPVLPVPLIAAVLIEAEGPVPRSLLAERAQDLAQDLAARGAPCPLPATPDATVCEALRALTARRLVAEGPEGVAPRAGADAVLAFYAGSLAQLREAGDVSASGQDEGGGPRRAAEA